MFYYLRIAYAKSMDMMATLIFAFSEISAIWNPIFTTNTVSGTLHCNV
ncbi:Uncharacterised protein [Serratia rubidaea]|uniref:Uncharacterized protein n=1 Tax=Serratia rubidaea TaxID=61652 RepID=A0A448S1T9_SERRU|nr:Uncharacterised protein [Serratia rubidaea]